MKILQSGLFKHKVKKLTKAQKLELDAQINLILENPVIGTEKKGDLRVVFAHKFEIKALQYLLAYRFSDECLELIMIGPHQNYYRDLRKHVSTK